MHEADLVAVKVMGKISCSSAAPLGHEAEEQKQNQPAGFRLQPEPTYPRLQQGFSNNKVGWDIREDCLQPLIVSNHHWLLLLCLVIYQGFQVSPFLTCCGLDQKIKAIPVGFCSILLRGPAGNMICPCFNF
ncbi:hypothetical protein PAMP_007639 [Pampus punctatissimus]